MSKLYIYYMRNNKNKPVITVILWVASSGEIYRAVSICSRNENPSKENGRSRAYDRLFEIVASRESTLHPITREIAKAVFQDVVDDRIILESEIPFKFKAERNPKLTRFERKLLGLDN